MSLEVLYILPPTPSFAGIERVVDEICSELADKYRDEISVHVLYTSKYDEVACAPKYAKIQTVVRGRLDLIRTVRREVTARDYHLVIVPQVEPTVLFWLACLGAGRRFVLYLHGNHKFEAGHLKAKILFFLMKRIVVHRLSGVFGVSPKQIESFQAMFPSSAPHYWVPNPVRTFDGVGDRQADGDCVTFVKVGRFSYQKGHDLLLRAFAQLWRIRPNVRLVLVGYGPEEPQLRMVIEELGLATVVGIEHYPCSPDPALLTADVYVSASRWEGWSLAICEALRFGLPVVATDCEFGPSDILTDPRLGRLVPAGDEAALVEAMAYYCDNLSNERRNAEYRRAYIRRFDAARVVHVHAKALAATSRAWASLRPERGLATTVLRGLRSPPGRTR